MQYILLTNPYPRPRRQEILFPRLSSTTLHYLNPLTSKTKTQCL